MAEYHCETRMHEVRTPLISGSTQHDYRCVVCGQLEREIRNSKRRLVRWINVTVKRRIEQQAVGAST